MRYVYAGILLNMGTLDPQSAVFIYAEMLLNMGTFDSQSAGGGIFQVFGQIRSVLGGVLISITPYIGKRNAWGRRNRVFYLERLSWCPVPGRFPGIFRMSVPDASFRALFRCLWWHRCVASMQSLLAMSVFHTLGTLFTSVQQFNRCSP